MNKRVDWSQAKADYVADSTVTLDDIAKKYNVPQASVKTRAARENWRNARLMKADMLIASAMRQSATAAAQELAHYNEQDLLAAKALRSMAARKLKAAAGAPLEAVEIRALASAVESAQRIARLALGASTDNRIHGDPPQDAIDIDLTQLTDEELTAFQQLLRKVLRRGKSPASETVQ